MDDDALFLSLSALSVSVIQAGVTCTNFLLTTQLERATREKDHDLVSFHLRHVSVSTISMVRVIKNVTITENRQ